VAAAVNPQPRTIQLINLDIRSLQGDKAIVEILQRTGADIQIDASANTIRVKGGQSLHGTKIDCSQIPDLFPIICVLATFCHDETVIYKAEHVRFKETDRIKVMNRELTKAGIHVEEKSDGMIIQGPQVPTGSTIQHDQDHRIAMAMTISAMFASSPSTIQNSEVVKDSYPNFYEDIVTLGAKIDYQE
jgi:3-phosphoshikimate 1-carboxyvinyltransferase